MDRIRHRIRNEKICQLYFQYRHEGYICARAAEMAGEPFFLSGERVQKIVRQRAKKGSKRP